MKLTSFTLFLLLFVSVAHAQKNPALAKQIDSLFEVDQAEQARVLDLFLKEASNTKVQRQDSIKKATYAQHTGIIKAIFSKYKFPTASLVGAVASQHFFVLAQHADSDPQFQLQLLPHVKKLAFKGDLIKKEYADFYDRVQISTGGKQLYGTQFPYNGAIPNLFDNATGAIIYPADLDDPQNVDKRRQEVGLEPLDQYYETVLKHVGIARPKPASQ